MDAATLNLVLQVKDMASGQVKSFTANVNDSSKSMTKNSETANAAAKKAAIAIGAVGAGLTLYAKSANDFTTEYVGNAKTLARNIGASIEDASRLQYAFSRYNLSVQDISGSLGIFAKNINEATGKSAANRAEIAKLQNQMEDTRFKISQTSDEIKKNGDKSGELGIKMRGLQADLAGLQVKLDNTGTSFDKLGISTVDNTGKQKDFNTILLEVADKFEQLPDGIQKTALSQELFGRSGKDMIKVLNLGSAGIKDLEAQADKLGLTLNAKTVSAVNKYVQSQKDLKDSTNAIKIAVGTLTAPVLADFNNRLNSVLQTLLQSNGAFRDATIGVLAFGGPVVTAAAGLVGFLANLSQIKPMLMAVSAFMTGPWGLAILGGIAVVAGLTAGYMALNANANSLRSAQDQVRISQEALTAAQTTNQQKALDLQGANLNVEASQRAYNDAVRQYGPASLEARQANYNLQQAILAKRDAENAANKALQDMKAAEQQYAKDKSFELSVAAKKDQVTGLNGAINALMSNVSKQASNAKGKSLGSVGSVLEQLQNAFGHRAVGGYVGAGQSVVVGETGREIFTPSTPGVVTPSNQTERILNTGGSGSDIHITNYNQFQRDTDPIAFARMQAYELSRR